MKRFTLNDGNTIPAIGYGVFMIPNYGPTYNAVLAALLLSDAGAFITGSTFLIDGGATASFYYGPLQPQA